MVRVLAVALVAAAVLCSVCPRQVAAFESDKPCKGESETKYPCGRRCEARCNAAAPEFCKGIQCLGFTCGCKEGYARNGETDKCLRTQDCPPNRCGFGEVVGPCGKTCEDRCGKDFNAHTCQKNGCVGTGCKCDVVGGYVRNEKTGQCVKIDDCPSETH